MRSVTNATSCSRSFVTPRRSVGAKRRKAARGLAASVQENLRDLALASASLAVEVGEGIGDDVKFLLSANRGEPPMPLSKVASGGELARVMLALRLVLSSAPPTLVFDEVDAGIGGEAALAVGRALADLGREHQVLVVTHLAQVAAFADAHFVVEKDEQRGSDRSRAVSAVEGEARVDRALADAVGTPRLGRRAAPRGGAARAGSSRPRSVVGRKSAILHGCFATL